MHEVCLEVHEQEMNELMGNKKKSCIGKEEPKLILEQNIKHDEFEPSNTTLEGMIYWGNGKINDNGAGV